MPMYEELMERLRNCATEAAPCKTCDMVEDSACTDTLMKQAADAIEELSRENESLAKSVNEASEILRKRWIPVTERLPELHEEVLVCNGEYGLSDLGFATVAVWDGTDWIEAWDRRTAIHCVTHWMPRPYPPKEE